MGRYCAYNPCVCGSLHIRKYNGHILLYVRSWFFATVRSRCNYWNRAGCKRGDVLFLCIASVNDNVGYIPSWLARKEIFGVII